MSKKIIFIFVIFSLFSCMTKVDKSYKSRLYQNSDDFSSSIEWYRNSKIGCYFDFGLHNMFEEYNGYVSNDPSSILYLGCIKPEDYEEKLKEFSIEDFKPDVFAHAMKYLGVKYIVMPAKDKDGFSLYNSKFSDYNIVKHTKFGQDIFKIISGNLKENGIKIGAYYSIVDWYHKSQAKFLEDGKKDFVNINTKIDKSMKAEYIDYMKNQIKELIVDYGIDMLYLDGDWVDWWTFDDAIDMVSYIKSLNPKILLNNLNSKFNLKTGDFDTYYDSFSMTHYRDRARDWELLYKFSGGKNPIDNTINEKSSGEIIDNISDAIIRGGNILFAIKPNRSANIRKSSIEIFTDISKWINRNGEAIYNTRKLDKNIPFLKDHTIYGGMTLNKDTETLYIFLKSEFLKQLSFLNNIFLPKNFGNKNIKGEEVKYKEAYLLTDTGRKKIKLIKYGDNNYIAQIDDSFVKEMKKYKIPVIAVEYDK